MIYTKLIRLTSSKAVTSSSRWSLSSLAPSRTTSVIINGSNHLDLQPHHQQQQHQHQHQQQHPINENKGNVLLLLGKPGGGKGTISGKILHDFPSFRHLSSGDLLRKHVKDGTDIGIEAKFHMDQGNLVPDELMIELIMSDASSVIGRGRSLLLDGFPRTIEQAVALDDSLDVDLVVNLDVPTETIVERISERWIHPGSGRVYNKSYKPPLVEGKDDVTGEPLVQRDDDKPESVRKRLEGYNKMTEPLIEYYEEKGVLKSFHGTMSDVIYPGVKDWLQGRLQDEVNKKQQELRC